METQWTPSEWEAMRVRLEKLTLKQLADLATKVRIDFTVGNNTITDKEDFLLALDEADRPTLEREYAAMIEIAI